MGSDETYVESPQEREEFLKTLPATQLRYEAIPRRVVWSFDFGLWFGVGIAFDRVGVTLFIPLLSVSVDFR